jgi:hypothetical protein
MKKLLLLLFVISLISCEKKNNTPNTTPTNSNQGTFTQNPSTTSVTIQRGVTTYVYVNNVLQPASVTSFSLNSGDVFKLSDNGQDGTLLNPDGSIGGHVEGYISIKVFINNVSVYEKACNCDALYTYTAQ